MITKFKIFENIDHYDVDPLGEEDWSEPIEIGSIVEVLPNMINYIGKKWSEKVVSKLIGKQFKVKQLNNIGGYKNCVVVYHGPDADIGVTGYLIPKDCIKIVENSIFENIDHSDIDPYGEENWVDINSILKVGDKIVNTELPEHYGEVIKINGDIITLSKYMSTWTITTDDVLEWMNKNTCFIESGE